MDIKKLEDLSYRVCKELDEFSKKRDLSTSDFKTLHDITGILKNIEKLKMCEEEGGYSRDGTWKAEMEGEYARGNSYRRDSRGRYARDGYARDGYSQDGYSTEYARGSMVEHLEQMMGSAGTEKERSALRQCIDNMRRM